MKPAALIQRYEPQFTAKYQYRLYPEHRRAMHAIKRCRTPDSGTVQWHCRACDEQLHQPRSCGHRSCPQCQNHETTQWLARQQAKLLPADYFMVTFTLPQALRSLAWYHPKPVYRLLLATAASTLKDFGLNPQWLGGQIGMTMVLHTHSRRLDYHPHCHVIVPGGAVDTDRKQWKKPRSKYLFNGMAVAKVFRARFLQALKTEGLSPPVGVPDQWVAHCKYIGKGQPALAYLSRYLYRGVLSERHIVADTGGQVTFQYTDSATGHPRYRTLPGEDFLWLLLQHVLPKGFRRVRDYGFLHGNAKPLLRLVQWALRVIIAPPPNRPRPAIPCPSCRTPMQVTRTFGPAWLPG